MLVNRKNSELYIVSFVRVVTLLWVHVGRGERGRGLISFPTSCLKSHVSIYD